MEFPPPKADKRSLMHSTAHTFPLTSHTCLPPLPVSSTPPLHQHVMKGRWGEREHLPEAKESELILRENGRKSMKGPKYPNSEDERQKALKSWATLKSDKPRIRVSGGNTRIEQEENQQSKKKKKKKKNNRGRQKIWRVSLDLSSARKHPESLKAGMKIFFLYGWRRKKQKSFLGLTLRRRPLCPSVCSIWPVWRKRRCWESAGCSRLLNPSKTCSGKQIHQLNKWRDWMEWLTDL